MQCFDVSDNILVQISLIGEVTVRALSVETGLTGRAVLNALSKLKRLGLCSFVPDSYAFRNWVPFIGDKIDWELRD